MFYTLINDNDLSNNNEFIECEPKSDKSNRQYDGFDRRRLLIIVRSGAHQMTNLCSAGGIQLKPDKCEWCGVSCCVVETQYNNKILTLLKHSDQMLSKI